MAKPYPSDDLKVYGLPIRADAHIVVSGELALRYFLEGYLTRVPDDEDIKKFAHTRTAKLIPLLADYFLASALGEARHWHDKSWAGAFGWSVNPTLQDKFGFIYKHISGGCRESSSREGWNHAFGAGNFTNPADLATVVESFFNHTPWNSSYGGPSWAYIAAFARFLYDVDLSDYFAVLSAMDKAAHVAHTGASLMLAPKFGWFMTPHLAQIVQMAADGDLCCWRWSMGVNANGWLQGADAIGTILKRALLTTPKGTQDRIEKWADSHLKVAKKHSCGLTWEKVRHYSSLSRPTEQLKYTEENPPIPPTTTGECLCFRCGTRYSSELHRCPRWCPHCVSCTDHADNWKEYHGEKASKKKKKGKPASEPQEPVQDSQG